MPHLGVEALEAARRPRRASGQELERDRLAELQVVGAVDLAHAAAAEQPDDAVALGEHGPGREIPPIRSIRRRQSRPTGSEGETRRRAASISDGVASPVGSCEAELTGRPQAEQYRPLSETSAEQEGHFIEPRPGCGTGPG